MRLLFAGLPALLLAACSPSAPGSAPTPGALMQSGFEESLGWNDVNPALFTTDKAHGGRVAAVVGPQAEFGPTFSRTLDELGVGGGAHRLELRGWVLRTATGSTARLVAQLDASATDETRVAYASLPVAEAVPAFGEWQEVVLPVEVPAGARGSNRFKVYLWNDKGTSPTYLDDVVLRRVDK